MSALWTSDEAVAATGGEALGRWTVSGVSIDSRTVKPGDLFVALKAARDGHEFVAQALAKGAGAALVSHIPENLPEDAPLLLVPDVLRALEDLGRAGRARTEARVIAVTGSVGKTTTKEMLRAALSGQGATHAAEASYNNHWGVPLTLARMPRETEFAIVEIGMNAPGEIAPLARLARPHVALITTIAPAHLEAFGAIEGIAREKASIFEGLEPGGVALVNADVDTADILVEAAKGQGARILRFGQTEGAEIFAQDIALTDSATVIRAVLNGTPLLFKLAIPGRHFALNALAALAAVEAAGADVAQAAMDLGRWQPVSGRGARERIILGLVDNLAIEVIDDAYNANPASLAAGLDVLAATDPLRGGRRIAVLGDMLELGPSGPEMHAEIADLPAMEAVDLVFTCGGLMEHLHDALPASKRGLHTESPEDLARALPRRLHAGDILLIKGSNGSRVSRVVDALRKLGQAPADIGEGKR